jgi:L-lysine exporter family protein LysE/ArgO
MNDFVAAAVRGAALAGPLIVGIGAQSAFVLSKGLERRHVLATALICSLSDVLLVGAGILGAGMFFTAGSPVLRFARWGGALYLAWLGAAALARARKRSDRLVARRRGESTLRATALQALALTYLNPHVYLDTVLLLGSVGGRELPLLRPAFALGASSVSFAWFFSLGFGGRALAPVFARPRAWRILDGVVGCTMLATAASLVRGTVR